MKKAVLIVTLFLVFSYLQAQLPGQLRVVWDKSFAANLNDTKGELNNFLLLPDSTVAVAYSTGQEHVLNPVTVIDKFDLKGNLVAERRSPFYIAAINCTSTGTIIKGGADYIGACSVSLDSLWTLPVPGYTITRLMVLPNGLIAATGVSDDGKKRITGTLDEQGRVIFSRTDSLDNGASRVYDLQQGAGNTYYVVMAKKNTEDTLEHFRIEQYDAVRGTLLRTISLPEQWYPQSRLTFLQPQQQYLLATIENKPSADTSSMLTLRYADVNLGLRSSVSFPYRYNKSSSFFNAPEFHFFPTRAGGLYFAQEVVGKDFENHQTDEYTLLGRMSPGGAIVYAFKVPPLSYLVTQSVVNILSLSGNDFLVCASVNYQGLFQARMVRFQEMTTPVASAVQITVYPNPTYGQIRFQWPFPSASSGNLTIANMQGTVVISLPVKSNPQQVLDVSSLRPGNYILKVQDLHGTVTSAGFIKR